jgi:imidazolonepropionase-like amidohydrolase
VLPGLIDSHVHLSSDLGGVAAQLAAVTREPVADVAYEAALNARKTLMAGFTTVRNLGDWDGVIRALRDAVAGKVEGRGSSTPTPASRPRRATPTRRWATARAARGPDRGENLCDGVESCRRAVREQIAQGAD